MAIPIVSKFLGIKSFSRRTQSLVQTYFSIYVFTMATIYISSTFYILFILDLVGFAQLGLLVSIG
ncbi:MAG: hypothetical protein ACW98K_14345, partial [Candidatus Kariarchaeaceae archaeon]